MRIRGEVETESLPPSAAPRQVRHFVTHLLEGSAALLHRLGGEPLTRSGGGEPELVQELDRPIVPSHFYF